MPPKDYNKGKTEHIVQVQHRRFTGTSVTSWQYFIELRSRRIWCTYSTLSSLLLVGIKLVRMSDVLQNAPVLLLPHMANKVNVTLLNWQFCVPNRCPNKMQRRLSLFLPTDPWHSSQSKYSAYYRWKNPDPVVSDITDCYAKLTKASLVLKTIWTTVSTILSNDWISSYTISAKMLISMVHNSRLMLSGRLA